jgi:CelD/BcsL family acetyltransferase involved in cellulose biosynthesis
VEDIRLPTKFGYLSMLRPKVRSITIPFGGIYGATDELAPLLIRELRAQLAAGAADVLWMPALRTDSPLHRAARTEVPPLQREPHLPVDTHRRLELADSYEAFLRSRSKSSRESAKRYRKKVDRELGDRLELRVYRDPADIDRIFADSEPVAAQTYQRALGVALEDTPQQRALIEVGLQRGWFRCYVAYLDGRPIAFWPGYGYDGTFYIGTPGYDPACADLRIGMYLLVRMIDDFCADPTLQAVDYGFGDAEYKRRYATESWEESDIRIFAPRARPVALRLFVTAQGALVRAATAALERAGVFEDLKRGWRRRLAHGSSASR